MTIDPRVWLCATCAVERGSDPAGDCPICADDRQYLPAGGQRWLRLGEAGERRVVVTEREPDLFAVTVEPAAGIGQTAWLVRTPDGVLMWDCQGWLDEAGVAAVREVGDVRWIACSHPHMFGAQVSWAHELGARVLVNRRDERWLQRTDPVIESWDDSYDLTDGLVLHRLGGHFRGSAVAHWRAGAEGRGVLLSGDTIAVNPDGTAAFMRSYPNRIPLSAAVVERVASGACALEFDRAYGNFGRSIEADARARIRSSADRHMAWVRGDHDHLT